VPQSWHIRPPANTRQRQQAARTKRLAGFGCGFAAP